jgi:hypothetical protein
MTVVVGKTRVRMKQAILIVFAVLALMSAPVAARECGSGETSFTLLSTQSGFAWHGMTISIGGFARAEAKVRSGAPQKNHARISFQPLDQALAEQAIPSLLWEGTLRLSSNVPGFARKFVIRGDSIEGTDLTFCEPQQLSLHCTEITGYVSEGAISMRCSIKVMEPESIISP